MLRRFLYEICGATGDYNMNDYLEREMEAVRAQVGDKRVLLGLSGGVDSSVCAALLSRAIPGRLTCIYIDHGFMRKNETEEVRAAFAGRALDLRIIDASEQFLKALEGVTDPEEKRKRIGREFVRAFEKAARDCGNRLLPGPGHHLSRRGRIRQQKQIRRHQEPPQRRRPAQGHEL